MNGIEAPPAVETAPHDFRLLDFGSNFNFEWDERLHSLMIARESTWEGWADTDSFVDFQPGSEIGHYRGAWIAASDHRFDHQRPSAISKPREPGNEEARRPRPPYPHHLKLKSKSKN